MKKHLAVAVGMACSVWSAGALAQSTPESKPVAAVQTVTGTSAVAVLNTALSSRNAKEGTVVKAYLRKAASLPDGRVLDRNAELDGVVVKVSKYSKTMPNGALMLQFPEITEKGKPAVAVNAWIAKLNAGGTAAGLEEASAKDRADELKAEAEEAKKAPAKTGLPGVFLQVTQEGSGTVFALGDDVYLDKGIEITVLLSGKDSGAAAK